MTTLHEQAVEAMAETTLTALGSYKRTMGDVARANLQALLSLIKDNEELAKEIAHKAGQAYDCYRGQRELQEQHRTAWDYVSVQALAALTKALGDD